MFSLNNLARKELKWMGLSYFVCKNYTYMKESFVTINGYLLKRF